MSEESNRIETLLATPSVVGGNAVEGNLARKIPADSHAPGSHEGRHASTKREDSDFPFAVALDGVYEGPLDLLLDLVRKQDIDIYDIPIAKLTAQYLAYVEKLRELDVNVAALGSRVDIALRARDRDVPGLGARDNAHADRYRYLVT